MPSGGIETHFLQLLESRSAVSKKRNGSRIYFEINFVEWWKSFPLFTVKSQGSSWITKGILLGLGNILWNINRSNHLCDRCLWGRLWFFLSPFLLGQPIAFSFPFNTHWLSSGRLCSHILTITRHETWRARERESAELGETHKYAQIIS